MEQTQTFINMLKDHPFQMVLSPDLEAYLQQIHQECLALNLMNVYQYLTEPIFAEYEVKVIGPLLEDVIRNAKEESKKSQHLKMIIEKSSLKRNTPQTSNDEPLKENSKRKFLKNDYNSSGRKQDTCKKGTREKKQLTQHQSHPNREKSKITPSKEQAKEKEEIKEALQNERQARCRFYPSCKNGDNCSFYHPTEKCPYFPHCKFVQECHYKHEPCRFAQRCCRGNCNYYHEHKARFKQMLTTMMQATHSYTTFDSESEDAPEEVQP